MEQGHTVGEAQAFSRSRRRRQQQPVDSGVRIPGGVQAHLHVGPGRDLHLPHGERAEPQLASAKPPPEPQSPPGPFPVPPHFGSTVTLTRLEGSQSAQADLGPEPGPHLARNEGGRNGMLQHRAPPLPPPSGAAGHTPKPGSESEPLWSHAHMARFDRRRGSRSAQSPAVSNPAPPLTEKPKRVARGLIG